MNFPMYNGVISGPLSAVVGTLVDAVSAFYTGNPFLDGILRIPALYVNGSATSSANFGG